MNFFISSLVDRFLFDSDSDVKIIFNSYHRSKKCSYNLLKSNVRVGVIILWINNIFFINYFIFKNYFFTQTQMISGDNIETRRFLKGANTQEPVTFSTSNQLFLNKFTTSFLVKYAICHQSRHASHEVLGLFQNRNCILNSRYLLFSSLDLNSVL